MIIIRGQILEFIAKNSLHKFNTQKKIFKYIVPRRKYSSSKPTPKIYPFVFQNPLKWLNVKLDLFALKNRWDATFSLSNFINGAKQAICTVMTLISENEIDDLQGLIKGKELADKIKSQMQKQSLQYLVLSQEEIYAATPINIDLHTIAEKKYCDIDMLFIAAKIRELSSNERDLLILKIKARFNREYTEGVIPSWIISDFNFKIHKKIA